MLGVEQHPAHHRQRSAPRRLAYAKPWARPRCSIISLVVAEGLLLTTLAGYCGVVAGVFALEAAGRAVRHLPNAPLSHPEISLQVALTAVLVLIVAGCVAGIVPARHAARVHPVEALRANDPPRLSRSAQCLRARGVRRHAGVFVPQVRGAADRLPNRATGAIGHRAKDRRPGRARAAARSHD